MTPSTRTNLARHRTKGHLTTRGNVYGPLVIAYLFSGGAAAGALFVISAWSFAARHKILRTPYDRMFDSLRFRTHTAGTILLLFALVCLLWDLEHPGKALLIFFMPHPTALTFGAYTLAIEAILAAALLIMRKSARLSRQSMLIDALEMACCIASLATMAYTGVFLFKLLVPLWHTWTIVGLFVFSSLSCGVSIVLLIDWLTSGTAPFAAVRTIQKAHLACLAFEGAFLAAFGFAAVSNPNAEASLALLRSGDMAATIGVGVVGIGIVIPFLLEAFSLTGKNRRALPFSDIACLFGGLLLRYCVIACGMH